MNSIFTTTQPRRLPAARASSCKNKIFFKSFVFFIVTFNQVVFADAEQALTDQSQLINVIGICMLFALGFICGGQR